MKRSLLISVLLTLVMFLGCSKDSSVVNPVSQVEKSHKKLIQLPVSTGLSAEAQNTFTFNVNGWEGAYQTMYLNFPGSQAAVSANYTFPKNVFTGQKTIVITFSNDKASASYTPSPVQFNSPVIANITYTGLNLSGVNPGNVDFVCVLPDGTFESVQRDRLEVNTSTGVLKLVNARLYHFSKYGFSD